MSMKDLTGKRGYIERSLALKLAMNHLKKMEESRMPKAERHFLTLARQVKVMNWLKTNQLNLTGRARTDVAKQISRELGFHVTAANVKTCTEGAELKPWWRPGGGHGGTMVPQKEILKDICLILSQFFSYGELDKDGREAVARLEEWAQL